MVGTGNPLFFYIFYRFTNGILLRTRRKTKIKSRQGHASRLASLLHTPPGSPAVSPSSPRGSGQQTAAGERSGGAGHGGSGMPAGCPPPRGHRDRSSASLGKPPPRPAPSQPPQRGRGRWDGDTSGERGERPGGVGGLYGTLLSARGVLQSVIYFRASSRSAAFHSRAKSSECSGR